MIKYFYKNFWKC